MIYAKIKTIKSPDLDPFLTILQSFHDQGNYTPVKTKAAWAPGNTSIQTPGTALNTTAFSHSSANNSKNVFPKGTPAYASRIINDSTLIDTSATPQHSNYTNSQIHTKPHIKSNLRNFSSAPKITDSAPVCLCLIE